MSNEVEAIQVPLGGQPNHPEPLTTEQFAQQRVQNAPNVLSSWKSLQDTLKGIDSALPVGNDPELNFLRSYVKVQLHSVTIKVELLGLEK